MVVMLSVVVTALFPCLWRGLVAGSCDGRPFLTGLLLVGGVYCVVRGERVGRVERTEPLVL